MKPVRRNSLGGAGLLRGATDADDFADEFALVDRLRDVAVHAGVEQLLAVAAHRVGGERDDGDAGPRALAGADAADVFGRGYQDLFVANVDKETFSLYRNLKNETFGDVESVWADR